MIFDITLAEKAFNVTITKRFFEEGFFYSYFMESPVVSLYHLGHFATPSSKTLGFNGCLKKIGEDENYLYFFFPFPKRYLIKQQYSKKVVLSLNDDGKTKIQEFLHTVYLLSKYHLERLFDKKIFFDEGLWADQSLSFSMIDTEPGKEWGGGYTYPWIREQISNYPAKEEINKYVLEEMRRVSLRFFGEEPFSSNVTITDGDNWEIQVDPGGKWISCGVSNRVLQNKKPFGSHNVEQRQHRTIAFIAITALNTFFRNK